MINSRYRPNHPLLKNIVRYFAFQSFEGTGKSNDWMTLFPNCTTNLCITFDSVMKTMDSSKIKNNISTSCIRPVTFSRCNHFKMVVIQLEPYGFHLLTGLPMKDFKNRFFQLDDFFVSTELECLYQQLLETKEYSLRVMLLEKFILRHLQNRQVDKRILFATRQIRNVPDIQLDELVDYLNLSARTLRELFSKHIGISPKYYLRLSRFNRVANEVSSNHNCSLTEIAVATGYFDQAHFIKEFKEFGGLSPNQFRKIQVKSADFYNFERAS